MEITKQELTERTPAEVRAALPKQFMLAKASPVGPIPAEQLVGTIIAAFNVNATYDSEALTAAADALAVALAAEPSPGKVDAIHTAMGAALSALPGITKAGVHTFGKAPVAEDTPAGKEIIYNVKSGFDYRTIAE